MRYLILFSCLCYAFVIVRGQNKYQLTDKNDYTSLYFFNPDKKGFEVSLSAVAVFTLGAKDRNGFRLGTGLNLSQDIGNFEISTGIDFYKANEHFEIGTTYGGIGYNDNGYGANYYVNKYYQGDKQISGIINLKLRDWQIRFEDDILGSPFTRFVVYDRYRSAGLEIRYRHFLIGTNVYTTDPNGLTDVSTSNHKGSYYTGKQISSPVYIGYSNKNLFVRYGINAPIGGYIGQNWWHEYLFGTSNFGSDVKQSQFLQLGTDKPYTLY